MSTTEVEKRVKVVESDGTPEGDERAAQSRWKSVDQVARWLERPLHHEDELADAGYRVVVRDKERGASVDPIALEIARDDVAASKRDAAREAQAATDRADEARTQATAAELARLDGMHASACASFNEARDRAEEACAAYVARLLEFSRADKVERRAAERIGRLSGQPPAARPERTFFGEAMRRPEHVPFHIDFYRPIVEGLPVGVGVREAVERELEKAT